MITSELQHLIDWDAIIPMPRYAGGHDAQMKALLKGATVLAHWNENDYQGTVATAVQLQDGRFSWYQDSYGSCSGCDSWEDANDDDVRVLCINLANSARVFDTRTELREDLRTQASCPRKWDADAATQLLEILNAHTQWAGL